MQSISHQTVRLSRGRHRSPQEGMCVMELASTLAGGPFSDHPRSVCPVIAALLRAYNDAANDERRQSLIPYAARVVDTHGDEQATRARAERCRSWATDIVERAPWWQRARRLLAHRPSPDESGGAEYAAWAIGTLGKKAAAQSHTDVLALVDELIAMSVPASAEPTSASKQLVLEHVG